MKKNIAIIQGDGIGPEVIQQSIHVLEAVADRFGHEFIYEYCLMGGAAIDQTGDPLPDETLQSCKRSDAILFGAIGDPKYDQAEIRPEQGLLKLRKELELFANIRPVKNYLPHLSPIKNVGSVDLTIFRELTGGIYFGKKEFNDFEAVDECRYTREEIERIAIKAFQFASSRSQVRSPKLTLVDKANVLETSRLWRKTIKEISLQFPGVVVEYMYVDNAAMQIILDPRQFDVILTENMFGDILSDEASVIIGSIGLLPSASLGDNSALFEPIHGSYPSATGKDIANPIGSILSAAMMLDHFEMTEEARSIREGVGWCLANGFVTKDLDPINYYSTSIIGELIADHVNEKITQGNLPII